MKALFCLVLVCFCNSAFADEKKDLLLEIDQLTKEIRSELLGTPAEVNTLQDVKEKLEESLALIKTGSTSGNDCYQFAFEKYYYSASSEVATNQAIDACKKIKDIGVAKFAFEKYYYSMNAAQAMNRARDVSGPEVKGKLRIVEFAFEKYYYSMNAAQAVDLALQKAASSSSDLDCLTLTFNSYYISNSANEAMNKAFAKCSE